MIGQKPLVHSAGKPVLTSFSITSRMMKAKWTQTFITAYKSRLPRKTPCCYSELFYKSNSKSKILEKLVNHSPPARNLQAFSRLRKRPAWVYYTGKPIENALYWISLVKKILPFICLVVRRGYRHLKCSFSFFFFNNLCIHIHVRMVKLFSRVSTRGLYWENNIMYEKDLY